MENITIHWGELFFWAVVAPPALVAVAYFWKLAFNDIISAYRKARDKNG